MLVHTYVGKSRSVTYGVEELSVGLEDYPECQLALCTVDGLWQSTFVRIVSRLVRKEVTAESVAGLSLMPTSGSLWYSEHL